MAATDFRQLQKRNSRGTWTLLFASFLLLAVAAAAASFATVGGVVAAGFAILFSFGMTATSYFQSHRIALATTRAQPAPIEDYRQLHNVVEEMAIAAGLPKPAVYVVNDPAPNAFATGRNPEHAAVAATTGLLAKLDRDELQGVMAHEMAHIRNHDIRVMTVAVATAGAIALLADLFWRLMYFGGGSRRSNDDNGIGAALAIVGFLVVAILAPLAAGLLQAAISRSREELADASAVELTRNPRGLRRALEKLDADVTVVRRTSHATSHLWIEAPDDHERQHKGRRFNDMFNTHPPLVERIDRLRAMEGLAPYEGPSPDIVRQVAEHAAAAPREPVNSWSDVGAAVQGSQLLGTASAAVPAAASGRPTSPAGWYPDPAGNARVRWWDGHSWTTYTDEQPSSA